MGGGRVGEESGGGEWERRVGEDGGREGQTDRQTDRQMNKPRQEERRTYREMHRERGWKRNDQRDFSFRDRVADRPTTFTLLLLLHTFNMSRMGL